MFLILYVFTLYKSFGYMPKQRHLDPEVKDEAVKLQANKKLVQNHLLSATGKTVTLKDVHNIATRNAPTHRSRRNEKKMVRFWMLNLMCVYGVTTMSPLESKGLH